MDEPIYNLPPDFPQLPSVPVTPGMPSAATAPPHKNMLAQILPLLAAGLASSQGGLPGFAQGLNVQRELGQKDTQLGIEQQREAAAMQAQRVAQARLNATEADRVARQQAEAEKGDNEFLLNWLKRVESNKSTVDLLNSTPPESYSIKLPSGKNLPLVQFFDRLGLPDKKFHTPTEDKPVTEPRVPLITGYGPNGQATRVPDTPGAAVYQRPRVGPKPDKAAEPSTSFATSDLAGAPTGIKKLTRSTVRDLLRQKNFPSDDKSVDAVMASPSAVKRLYEGE